METTHTILISDSRRFADIPDASIDLVVTSPPYPMIEMWDGLFSSLSPGAHDALGSGDGMAAFEAMHRELDKTWAETARVLKSGAFACINIGDATRTINGRFRLYPNHSRITGAFVGLGFDSLPVILWKKTTNAPNKFMGSGMLPAGAYVTLEHEYILIFRKGAKRLFASDAEKERRMKSAFFWEERNKWFSDVWEIKGAAQNLGNRDLRERSGAFPQELAHRLISMYSLYGDTVLDPFAGTGTTLLAAIALCRNSIMIEIDGSFLPLITELAGSFKEAANEMLSEKVKAHLDFISAYERTKAKPKYMNEAHGFPVITNQEKKIELLSVDKIYKDESALRVSYSRYVECDNRLPGF
jgi:modification methylase